ncbi:MAG: HAMP domain-containing protein [Candidatus Electrothrix sp. AR3]|nr:HAMP domain-containing protein [Candidatus Electrothrix sp. AR3]
MSPMSSLLQAADATSLKHKSLFFFVLTALLTLITTVGVLNHSQNSVTEIPVFVFLILVFLFCTLVVAMLCFQYYVIKPLADVNTTAQLMIDGHLDNLSRVKRVDEIGRLSESINDLAMNMQEVLLFVWNHSQERRELLERITEHLSAFPDAEKNISSVKDDIIKLSLDNEDLKAIVTSFSYFEIRMEHEKMLAECDCRQQKETCCSEMRSMQKLEIDMSK